ncbi:MAG: (Fe-S)-binding protein [Stackebrandtia sp.]
MSTDDLRGLVDTCVHCGFCLSTCPTYELWGQEMDSPRGRIQLMKLGLEGEELTDSTVTHMDRCLGCMACLTACPSGVRYDVLIAAKRAEVEENHERSRAQRWLRGLIFALFPRPGRLRLLRGPLRIAQWLRLDRLAKRVLSGRFPGLATMAALAPRLGPRPRLPHRVAASEPERATVGMLTGCVQREFFPEVNAATARVLAAEGCRVEIPARQGCCGALSLHSGRRVEAAGYARSTIEAFGGVDTVVVNAAGCGSAMKEYGDVLADDPQWAGRARDFAAKVRDASEYLAELEPRAPRHPLNLPVAYHDACHLAHAQGISAQPRELLRAIPGLEVREIADAEICCGSAGVYNILQPEAATELGDRKAANVLSTEAELLVSANPGCAMQIASAAQRRGQSVRVAHLVEVLDASIRGRHPDTLR